MLWDVMVPLYIKDGREMGFDGKPFDVYQVRWSTRGQVQAKDAAGALKEGKKLPSVLCCPAVQRTEFPIKVAA